MITKGLVVKLVAQAGQEEALAAFLAGALPLAEAEPGTPIWLGLRNNEGSTFWVVDAFLDDAARGTPERAHRRRVDGEGRRTARRPARDQHGRRIGRQARRLSVAGLRAQGCRAMAASRIALRRTLPASSRRGSSTNSIERGIL